MLVLSLSALATIFELAGLAWVLLRDASGAIAAYFGFHLIASLFAATAMSAVVPVAYSGSRFSRVAYFFTLSFFVPLVGVTAVLALMLVVLVKPLQRVAMGFRSVSGPRFSGVRAETQAVFKTSRVRMILDSSAASVDLKLKALTALQGIESEAANELIRGQLGAEADDVRLFAYGLLDSREKVFEAGIHELRSRLAGTPEPGERGELLRKIGHLYWQLIEVGIAQGDLLRHALVEANRYTVMGLELQPDDAGGWLLLTRILLRQEELKSARDSVRKALDNGLARDAALPLLAEIAFRERRFGETRALMRELSGYRPGPVTARLAAYWTST